MADIDVTQEPLVYIKQANNTYTSGKVRAWAPRLNAYIVFLFGTSENKPYSREDLLTKEEYYALPGNRKPQAYDTGDSVFINPDGAGWREEVITMCMPIGKDGDPSAKIYYFMTKSGEQITIYPHQVNTLMKSWQATINDNTSQDIFSWDSQKTNQAAIDAILKAHNDERDEVGVPHLTWSDDLAQTAQQWADKMVAEKKADNNKQWYYRRDSGATVDQQLKLGENIYSVPGLTSVVEPVRKWASAKIHYDEVGNGCFEGADCSEYTQIVAQNTTQVGCGVARLQDAQGKVIYQVVVCNYKERKKPNKRPYPFPTPQELNAKIQVNGSGSGHIQANQSTKHLFEVKKGKEYLIQVTGGDVSLLVVGQQRYPAGRKSVVFKANQTRGPITVLAGQAGGDYTLKITPASTVAPLEIGILDNFTLNGGETNIHSVAVKGGDTYGVKLDVLWNYKQDVRLWIDGVAVADPSTPPLLTSKQDHIYQIAVAVTTKLTYTLLVVPAAEPTPYAQIQGQALSLSPGKENLYSFDTEPDKVYLLTVESAAVKALQVHIDGDPIAQTAAPIQYLLLPPYTTSKHSLSIKGGSSADSGPYTVKLIAKTPLPFPADQTPITLSADGFDVFSPTDSSDQIYQVKVQPQGPWDAVLNIDRKAFNDFGPAGAEIGFTSFAGDKHYVIVQALNPTPESKIYTLQATAGNPIQETITDPITKLAQKIFAEVNELRANPAAYALKVEKKANDKGITRTTNAELFKVIDQLKALDAANIPQLEWQDELADIAKEWVSDSNTFYKRRNPLVNAAAIAAFVDETDPLWNTVEKSASLLMGFCNKELHFGGVAVSPPADYVYWYGLVSRAYQGDELSGRPYDTEIQDLAGPTLTTGGAASKDPEIIPYYNQDQSIDVAWRDQNSDNPIITITRYQLNGATYQPAWNYQVPDTLYFLAGFTKDEQGNCFVLTAVNEELSMDSSVNTYRDGILRLTKLSPTTNPTGLQKVWTQELNKSTYSSAKIYEPLTSGTSRLVYGAGKVFATFSKHTEYDPAVTQRHQDAMWLVVDAQDGLPIPSGSARAASHSFDQRAIFDGENFLALHMGDNYPRGLALIKVPPAAPEKQQLRIVYTYKSKIEQDTNSPKASSRKANNPNAYYSNDNNTYTCLGDVCAGKNGYVVLFASERNITDFGKDVNEPLNLAMVHIKQNFDAVQVTEGSVVTTAIVDTKTRNPGASGDQAFNFYDFEGKSTNLGTTGIVWLTNYTKSANGFACVARPKLVKVADDRYIVIWEQWQVTEAKDNQSWPQPSSYLSTWALVIDEYGNKIGAEKELGAYRLNRTDDAFALADKAAWITGNQEEKALYLHTLDLALNVTRSKLAAPNIPQIKLIRTAVTLAIHPTNPNILYVGTRDRGVYKSVDGGSSWSPVNKGLPDLRINALAIDPTTQDTLYVGGVMDGIYKSMDGGSSWVQLRNSPSTINDFIAVHPTKPNIVYAGIAIIGSSCVYKSMDGGDSWKALNTGITSDDWISCLAINPRTPDVLYFGTHAHGLFKSTDGGISWKIVSPSAPISSMESLIIVPTIPETLYAQNRKSPDGGVSWLQTGLNDDKVRALTIHPLSPETLYALMDDGTAFQSTDGGASWTRVPPVDLP